MPQAGLRRIWLQRNPQRRVWLPRTGLRDLHPQRQTSATAPMRYRGCQAAGGAARGGGPGGRRGRGPGRATSRGAGAAESRRIRSARPVSPGWTRHSRACASSRACRWRSIPRILSGRTASCAKRWAISRAVSGRPLRGAAAAEHGRSQSMSSRTRLDAELVRRGLARSREQAAELIAAGRVAVAGQLAGKAATQVGHEAAITVRGGGAAPEYASRGGHKLEGALAAFTGLQVTSRRCLDAGASAGGFTDVLLRRGAAQVVAVDVGYGQLAWPLRTDPRVTVLDRVNVRGLLPEQVAPAPGLVTADLSFISLVLVLPALVACAAPDADFVLLVKPQFEVGRGKVGTGGVVRDPALRESAVAGVAAAALELGLGVPGVVASPLPGPSGNVEYFLWLRQSAPPLDRAALQRAITEGPQ